MKIKTFVERSIFCHSLGWTNPTLFDLNLEVSEWIEENDKIIEIIDIKYNSLSFYTDNGGGIEYSAVILYKEGKK